MKITFADPRQYIAALIYFCTSYYALDVQLPVAASITAAIFLCWAFDFGRTWIMNAGILLLIIAFLVIAGWVPKPSGWFATIRPSGNS